MFGVISGKLEDNLDKLVQTEGIAFINIFFTYLYTHVNEHN